ncbi:MAG: PSD1 domain-containing protein [Planctomycetaceae bacterium]|nr:PSD1 domain-containing protein [Planctomycetaceae bacterium]
MRPTGILTACLVLLSISNARAADDRAAFFESKVRPILAARCHGCHGVKKQESNFRLDTKVGFLKGGDNGAVIDPKQPDQSELVLAIRREGGRKMPPDKPLPAEEIDTIVEWVRRGAFWPAETTLPANDSIREAAGKHWAFQLLQSPPVPRLPNDNWSRAPLDRFVRAKLREAGLSPSPIADRRTLLRRVSFDLIGLPPTPDEMTEFLADDRPDAFERVVDRLLTSPHYGERWGRHWLDVARYADTKGYVFFEEKKFPWAWTYRDYVIRSLNDDLPFDRFVVEQLAADQLELGDDKRPLTAMGFLTLGGRFMNNLHDVLDDRIDVVSRGLLGLTATCARCHDHKFDPIPQADYYSLYGVFRSSIEPPLPPEFLPPPQTEEYAKFSAEMTARQKKLTAFVAGKHFALVTSARARAAEYLLAAQAQMEKPPTDDFMLLADTNDINPTMTLRWQVTLEAARKKWHPVWQPWTEFASLPSHQFAAKAIEVCERLNSGREPKADGRKPLSQPLNPLVITTLCESPPKSLAEVATRYGELLKRIDAKWQEALKQEPKTPMLSDPHEEEIRRVLYGPDAPPDVPLAMGWGFLSLFPDRPTQGEYQKLIKDLEQWSMTTAGAPARAMVLFDDATPFDPQIFLRGNPNRFGAHVPRQPLAISTSDRKPFTTGSGRLELARSIVDPRNPLTARVFVNRVWMHHFGTGLVKTPSDFGLRSDPPSHPELLDWLAANFIRSGWSVKWLHRQIVLSATYQQASPSKTEQRLSADGSRQSADPDNRWLSQMNRRRLEWESLRDALLATSGEMNRRIGGESVELLGGFNPRRTLYGTLDRLDVPNLLTTFDFPTPASTNPQRDSTTVAPQALFLMNGDLTFEVASRLLRRPEVVAAADAPSRVRQLFLICFQRTPTDTEQQSAREFLSDAPTPERWAAFAQSLLLANEFAFVD